MVGQKRLLKIFDDFTFESIPKTMMLVGEYGCGKHSLVGLLSTKFNCHIQNISDKLTYEKISNLYISALPAIYLIDSVLTIPQQNSLLKFIEEPPKNSIVILLAESEDQYIPTICGRCITYKFDEYSDDELRCFTQNTDYLSFVRTPGKLIELSSDENSWVFSLNRTILTKIQSASIPNTLTLVNKFSYGTDDGGINIDLEMSLLERLCISLYKELNDVLLLSAHMVTTDYIKKFSVPNIDKKKLFSLYLLDLKRCLKGK